MESKKVLLRLSDVKQYFPLKTKGLFVKANDGITLDIYEGETFGLVGESGCGKSTLGRTLLQLYRQTDGRTMYYGRTIDEVAPMYIRTTLRRIRKLRAHWHELEKKRDRAVQEYEAILRREKSASAGEHKNVEREMFARMNERDKAVKDARDALLDIANIIGGFMVVQDIDPVVRLFLRKHALSVKLNRAETKRDLLARNRDDAAFAIRLRKQKGKPLASLEGRLAAAEKKAQEARQDVRAIQAEVDRVEGRIEELRRQHADDPNFAKYEAYHDKGIDLARLTYNEMRQLRSDMQLIFQDPYSSLNPRMTAGQIIGESLLAHKRFKRNGERMQLKVLETMDSCGLAPYFLHRYPHQFSGGQRQRIGIARALAVGPKFVVCDEAVSALDVSIQSQIINLLQDLKEQKHLTYLFITHDLSVVKYISDRIGVMYLGNMVELAPAQEIFGHPVHPYTVALLDAIPTTEERRDLVILEGDIPSPVNPPKGCKFHTRCAYCTDICTQVTPQWEEVGPGHFVACHHKLTIARGKEGA